MKKFLMTLIMAMLLLSLSIPMFAAADGASWGEVPITLDEIDVDGIMDSIYEDALSIVVDVPANADTKTGTSGEAWILWDGIDTFYIYAEIMDKEVLEPKAGANAWDTDSLEVFIDYSNANARTRDQYRIDAQGVPTYYATATVNEDKVGDYGFEAWAVEEIDGGYALEFQIRAYKEAIKAGMKIGFDLQINDMYGSHTRATFHAPSKNAANGNAAKYDYIVLSDEEVFTPVEEAPAAADTTAPATADPMLILAAAAVLSGAAAVTFKRK